MITLRGHETQLWHTADPIASPSSIPTQPVVPINFLLDFSPDRSVAATAQLGENVVTVLDLKSGDPHLIIDTSTDIYGLRVSGSAIVVIGEGRIITWSLPARDHVFNARVTIDDSVQTVILNHHPMWLSRHLISATVSPDFKFIVTRWWEGEEGEEEEGGREGEEEGEEEEDYKEGEGEVHQSLDIYDMSTGNHLVGTTAKAGYMSWITPDGCEVWCLDDWPEKGWKILKDSKSNVIGLEPLPDNTCPPGGYPWISPHGHSVADDGWIFNSSGKQLMWLPHHWRKDERDQMWSGQFLGLLDRVLPEPIIIELCE